MVEGVVNFIYQEKKIAIVPEKQIEDIRTFLESGLPGSAFGCEGYMRLSFATSMENLKQATKRIQELL